MARSGAASRHRVIAAGFIACAMFLGGGGWPSPATEIALELLCAAAAAAWLWLPGEQGEMPLPRGRDTWLLAALIVAVPIVQLVPLPPAVWRSLPGQQDRIAAVALLGGSPRWEPLTLSPLRTLAALLALLPPLFAFVTTASLSARGRMAVVAAIAGVGLTAALFGGVQVSLGAAAPRLYTQSNAGLTGFQANKNAAADVLLIGAAAIAVTLSSSLAGGPGGTARLIPDRRVAWLVFGGTMAVMVLATMLTNSRAGVLLIPLTLVGCWAIVSSAGATAKRWRWAPAFLVASASALIGLAMLAEGSHALGPVFARFAAGDDFRRELWRDAWFAVRRSWPSGIGLGEAQQALIASERLEIVDPSVPNRVHNDYLEFLLEGGIVAVAVLLAAAALLAIAARRAWRARTEDRPQIALGVTILLIVACHSLVDYPLRSMALACLTGVGAGLLLAPPARRDVVAMREAAA